MGLLEGKVGLVTGSGSGIGRETALVAAREGSKLTVADINIETGEETAELIRKAGGEAIFIRTDVSKADDVEAMVSATVEAFGGLDWASNNAMGGSGAFGPLEEVSDHTWYSTLAVCLTGVFFCVRAEARVMLPVKRGSIINISSAAALKGEALLSAYASAKGGVEALTKTAATEFGQRGVRVNAVLPGGIETPAIARYFEALPEVAERTIGAHAMRRLGKPSEIADAVVFLASDKSSFVTGHSLLVDGGSMVNSHML